MKLKLYFITLYIFIGMDSLWRGLVATYYGSRVWLWDPLVETFNPVMPGILYIMVVGGLCYFAVDPSLDSGGVRRAKFSGALFGMIVSASYIMTGFRSSLDQDGFIALLNVI